MAWVTGPLVAVEVRSARVRWDAPHPPWPSELPSPWSMLKVIRGAAPKHAMLHLREIHVQSPIELGPDGDLKDVVYTVELQAAWNPYVEGLGSDPPHLRELRDEGGWSIRAIALDRSKNIPVTGDFGPMLVGVYPEIGGHARTPVYAACRLMSGTMVVPWTSWDDLTDAWARSYARRSG